jgi:type IV pilus biogenesis protein PilP
MLNKKLKLALAAALTFPVIAFADPAITQDSSKALTPYNPAAERIAQINERLAILSAELAELEMKSKIVEKRAEISKNTNPSIQSAYSEGFVPSVDFIDGIDGKYKASLYVQGGNTQSVRVGDKVGAWKVKEIKMDSVTVQKDKEVIRLGFGAYTLNPEQPQGLNGTNQQVPPITR